MKKFLSIFILFILLSCSSTREIVVMDKTYGECQRIEVMDDISKSFKVLETDSVPITEWRTFQGYDNGDGYYVDRVHTFCVDKKTQYQMVFITTIVNETDSTFYRLKILCKTQNENLYIGR